jgi:hypothetical protein
MEEKSHAGQGALTATAEPVEGKMLRLAVISSPRAGNTWMRTLLGTILEAEQIAAHRPSTLNWNELPERCVLQIHWRPDHTLVDLLEQHKVHVIAMSRHPLDLLMSVLNYSYYIHEERRCPGGGACSECSLVGQSPLSAEHMNYACGPGGELLFSYSSLWWERRNVSRVRYEDLVEAPELVLARLLDELGVKPRRPLNDAIRETSIDRQRSNRDAWHCHYWQGQPGIWKSLLPSSAAKRIAAANRAPFAVMGYTCDPDENLTAEQADLNWARLQLNSVRANFAEERARHAATASALGVARADTERALRGLWEAQVAHSETRDSLAASQAHHERTWQALLQERSELEQVRAELAQSKEQLADAQEQLAPMAGVGPAAIQLAQRVSRWAERWRRLSNSTRRVALAGPHFWQTRVQRRKADAGRRPDEILQRPASPADAAGY